MFATPMVNLYTNDIGSGLAFYRDHFGFVETFRTPREGMPTHVELRLDGFNRLFNLPTTAAIFETRCFAFSMAISSRSWQREAEPRSG
jgi:catechol 2,3-dioxygenase-like lactoylglutathione lyase family enzyme